MKNQNDEELNLLLGSEIRDSVCEFYGVSWANVSRYYNKVYNPQWAFPRKVIEYCLVKIAGFNYTCAGNVTGVSIYASTSGIEKIEEELFKKTDNGLIAAKIIDIVKERCDNIKDQFKKNNLTKDILKYRSLLNSAIYEYETNFGEVPTKLHLQTIKHIPHESTSLRSQH